MTTTTKRPKAPIFKSPKGVFRYPALMKPDYGTKDYPKPKGVYKVDLILSKKDAAPLIKTLTPLHNEAALEGKKGFAGLQVAQRKKLKELTVNPIYTEEYDKETEEPTGNLIFRFTSDASGTRKDDSKWTRKLPVYDAKLKPIVNSELQVWGGTVGLVNFSVRPYFIAGTGACGIKLALEAVQIIELVSGGARTASDYGFEEEEGYEAGEDATTPSPFSADAGASDEDTTAQDEAADDFDA